MKVKRQNIYVTYHNGIEIARDENLMECRRKLKYWLQLNSLTYDGTMITNMVNGKKYKP